MRDQWEIHGNFQELTYLPGRYPLDPSDFISHLASRNSTDIYIYTEAQLPGLISVKQ
jgi:hypothetical protein